MIGTMPRRARRVDNYRAALRRSAKGLRLGVPREHFFDMLSEDVRRAFDQALRTLRHLGLRTMPVSIPSLPHVSEAEMAIMMPEAAAYHARALRTRPDDFGLDVRGVLDLGRLVPATAMLAAQRLRARLAAEYAAVFERVDALVVPSLAVAAPRIGETMLRIGDATVNVGMVLSRTMMPFNLTGLPAIAVPCGRSGRHALGNPIRRAPVRREHDPAHEGG